MTPGLTIAPHCRVIVDNDFQGDPDGLVALAHHLVSPANRVTAVTSSFLNPRFPVTAGRAADGAALASELIEVIGDGYRPPVHAGSEQPFGARSGSAASAAIIAAARAEDDLPLYVACGGPLTNVASALRDAPDIASRLTLVWIGGSLTDPPDWAGIGGVWPLGDSPTVLVTALSTESSRVTLSPAEPGRGAPRRVYTDLDFRLIVGDMLARFRLHERVRLLGPLSVFRALGYLQARLSAVGMHGGGG